jgi:pyrimidine-specific ribonucleoside hydrolase
MLFCNVSRALIAVLFFAVLAPAQTPNLIIDTDAGSDDILAISYLLSHPSVHIDAITIANGLAHVDAGARNLAKLVEVSGRPNVPVFAGRPTPLKGSAEFPREWRKLADELPGVKLPSSSRTPSPKAAADYLIEHLKDKKHVVRILALGPLTNLAEALQREPSIAQSIQQIVIMGGAIQVPGNLGDGGVFQTNNKTAEWNIYVDPLAARIVFRSHIPILLVPLDATNKVPIDLAFLAEFQTRAVSPLGRVAAQVLEADRESIDGKYFFAWDPLAAVALLHPEVIRSNRLHIDVLQDSPAEGTTAQTPGNPNADVAMDADAARFRKIFLEAFEK